MPFPVGSAFVVATTHLFAFGKAVRPVHGKPAPPGPCIEESVVDMFRFRRFHIASALTSSSVQDEMLKCDAY